MAPSLPALERPFWLSVNLVFDSGRNELVKALPSGGGGIYGVLVHHTPRTNGKAERFIQTALREWAYARSYMSSEERGEHLPAWLHQYNWHRPHASLDYQPPTSRLEFYVNNLVGLHI